MSFVVFILWGETVVWKTEVGMIICNTTYQEGGNYQEVNPQVFDVNFNMKSCSTFRKLVFMGCIVFPHPHQIPMLKF